MEVSTGLLVCCTVQQFFGGACDLETTFSVAGSHGEHVESQGIHIM